MSSRTAGRLVAGRSALPAVAGCGRSAAVALRAAMRAPSRVSLPRGRNAASVALAFVHCLFYHAAQRFASEKLSAAGAGLQQFAGGPSRAPSTEEDHMHFESDPGETSCGRARAAEHLLDAHAKRIVQRLLELAEKGDPTALRLCLERLSPPLRERPLQFELPPLATPADAVAA